MSIEEKSAINVRGDMLRYLDGEEPDLDLVPKLSPWAVIFLDGRVHVEGRVGPRWLRTSDVIWMDCDFRWCRTRRGLFALGERESEVDMDMMLEEQADD